MSDANCICIRCKRSFIELESHGMLLTGCVNCNIWWKASGGPVREYVPDETLRVLTQGLTGTAASSWNNPPTLPLGYLRYVSLSGAIG